MVVLVVNVRIVAVAVRDGLVLVQMSVWFGAVPRKVVVVLVMGIVDVWVAMQQRLVCVHVFVAFSQVQPDTGRHQYASQPERRGSGFAEADDGNRRANEGGDGKVGSRPSGTQTPQSDDK